MLLFSIPMILYQCTWQYRILLLYKLWGWHHSDVMSLWQILKQCFCLLISLNIDGINNGGLQKVGLNSRYKNRRFQKVDTFANNPSQSINTLKIETPNLIVIFLIVKKINEPIKKVMCCLIQKVAVCLFSFSLALSKHFQEYHSEVQNIENESSLFCNDKHKFLLLHFLLCQCQLKGKVSPEKNTITLVVLFKN